MLFSVKGRLTKGELEIHSDSETIHSNGEDPLGSNVNRTIPFADSREIEGKGLEILVIRLTDGEEIQFKNVEELSSLLEELGSCFKDVTHDLVRKRVIKYEERVRKWGGG